MNSADSYHEALNSHRHYDTMANAALSLLGAAVAGTPALYASVSQIAGSEFILALSAAVIYFAVQTYRRFDRYAGIALNVASAIERADKRFTALPLGFATIFAQIEHYRDLDSTGESRTYKRIRIIGYGASLLFLVAACVIFSSRFLSAA
jgi:hypothetical protein